MALLASFAFNAPANAQDPSFTAGPDINSLEDVGNFTATAWAQDVDLQGGTNARFDVLVDDASLFSLVPAVDVNSGTLTFGSAADANGVANLTVQLVTDQGQSAVASVSLTLSAVNDEPSFTAGAAISVNEDSGAGLVASWATALSAGPADEAGQGMSFSVATDNPGLFSVPPTVDASSGDLSFTVADDQHGIANLTVVLTDDGGVANGGDDTSQPDSGVTTLLPVNDGPLAGLADGWTIDSLGVYHLYGNGVDDVDTREGDGASSMTMIMEASLACSEGTMTLPDSAGAVSFLVGDGVNDAFMTMEGTVSGISTALGHLVYTEDPGFGGDIVVSLTIDDRGNYGSGGPIGAGDNTSLSVGSALGVATPYDIFSIKQAKVWYSQVNGSIAGGGPVRLNQFSMATNPNLVSTDDVLISGAKLLVYNGIVGHGNAVYCTTHVVDNSVTFLDSSQAPRQGCPIDFLQAKRELQDRSSGWGLLPATGTTTMLNGVLTLVGNDPSLNVFTVAHVDFQSARLLDVSTPPGAYALINVDGGSLIQGIWGVRITGATRRGVVVNAFQATYIHLKNVNFDASLLAPDAVLKMAELYVAGNSVAKNIQTWNVSTLGENLAGSPFDNPHEAGWDGDGTGVDTYDYTLSWTPNSSTEQIFVTCPTPSTLEVSVDGAVISTQRYDCLSRLVFVGRSDFSALNIDASVTLPVELSGLAPVGYDDRVEMALGVKSIVVDVLANDLAGPAALDPASVTVVSGPRLGTVSVDPATGQVTYQRSSKLRNPASDAVMLDRFTYTLSDVSGNQSTPTRVLITSRASLEGW
jgi:choice-of-anchor A domain-containing protein